VVGGAQQKKGTQFLTWKWEKNLTKQLGQGTPCTLTEVGGEATANISKKRKGMGGSRREGKKAILEKNNQGGEKSVFVTLKKEKIFPSWTKREKDKTWG